jgi:hypothetical protein
MNNSEELDILQDIWDELQALHAATVNWTKVDYPHAYKNRYHAIDIQLWAEEHCGDEFKQMGRTFYFKDKKDAEFFLLKWS